MPPPQNLVGFSLPKPGPVLRVVLIGLFASWLVFALRMNWAGVSEAPFYALTADQAGLLAGQVWRLVTASLIHSPFAVAHILSALLGLYFLGTSLESSFGSRRFAAFLFWSATLPYLIKPCSCSSCRWASDRSSFQPGLSVPSLRWKRRPSPGLSRFAGRPVNLFFVLPVTSKGLVWFVVGFSILGLIAAQTPPSGHLAAFAGMAIGYLSWAAAVPLLCVAGTLPAACADSSARSRAEGRKRQKRARDSGLRVIPGGRDPQLCGDPP